MKKVIGFLSLLVAISLIIYFLGPNLLSRLTRDFVSFPTKGDQVKVDIARSSDIPDDMEIKNKSKIKVKVCAYNSNDWVRAIARAEWDLDPDQSASYWLENYWFKVFKPWPTLLAKGEIIGSKEVEITGDQKNIKISGQRKKNVTFTDKTRENIRIVTYKAQDRVHILGLIDWYLAVAQKIEWDNASRTFNFKVFRPQLLDKPLAAASNVRDQSDIVIRSRGIWDWIKDLFS
jgi:hypothetical protein